MSDRSSLIINFKKKIAELKKHNNLYFNLDRPVISDQDYDNLKNELITLENNHNDLKKLNLMKNLVGAPPTNKFNKIKHLKPMLSLSNAFDKNDMLDFLKK